MEIDREMYENRRCKASEKRDVNFGRGGKECELYNLDVC